jgi:hypothetical protein
MMFDIQSKAPAGYEIIDFRPCNQGEYIMGNDGEPFAWGPADATESNYLILRKKWTPKVGEVIAVRQNITQEWRHDSFLALDSSVGVLCAHDRHYNEYRQQTHKNEEKNDGNENYCSDFSCALHWMRGTTSYSLIRLFVHF